MSWALPGSYLLLLLGKIALMYPEFHFNYKFDLQFWELSCDTLIFEKTYAQIPPPPYSRSEKTKIPLNAITMKIYVICLRLYSLNSTK